MGRIQQVEQGRPGREQERAGWLAQEVRARPARNVALQLVIGVLSGAVAVLARLSLPLKPEQLPTITVVIALAVVTTFVGAWGGIATAIAGGLLSWYFVFNPSSWSLANDAWIPLAGFTIISIVIVTTAQLYRSSARASHRLQVARLQAQAENADLFARELAHRLKNTLAIAQALAFQTIGTASEDAGKFAARLKALADANELLSEHIDTPSSTVTNVVESALAPFGELRGRFHIASVDAVIPSQQVISLALALHELTTNAIKHGALSTADGRVSIFVEKAENGLFLNWNERDGPRVTEPQQTGFGTRLLSRSGVDTVLAFEPDGLRCSIRLRTIEEASTN